MLKPLAAGMRINLSKLRAGNLRPLISRPQMFEPSLRPRKRVYTSAPTRAVRPAVMPRQRPIMDGKAVTQRSKSALYPKLNISAKYPKKPPVAMRPAVQPIQRPVIDFKKPIPKTGAYKVSAKIEQNRKLFIQWTKKNFPNLYHKALLDIKRKSSLNGMGGFFSDLTSSLTDLAPSFLQFKQQKDLMKMQLQRAKEGLPPANVSDYTPVLKTQIDLAPDTRRAIVGKTADLMKPLMIGGGILLAIIAIKKLK